MSRLSNAITQMFATKKGSELYKRIENTISKNNMESRIDSGVLIGFSGGADSVFLTCFLWEYRRREGKHFSMLAVHVNHCIRGDEANRDQDFSETFARELDIHYEAVRIDVPALGKEQGIGIEEAARNARYSYFDAIIRGRKDISTISVAHNATDNSETVLMNILRGSGLSGVCGIKPVRDNVIRPIISISKSEITDLLCKCGIDYVTDSTNLSTDYSRNYVRNEILPLLKRLSQNPDAAFTRLTENLRTDLDYLNQQACYFINDRCSDNIPASALRELHPSVLARVISMLVHDNTGIFPEEKHISAISELLGADNFQYSLPGEKNFACERGICSFPLKKKEKDVSNQIFSLTKGENKIYGTNLTVYVGEVDKTSLNVYNFSIQANISSDIINNGLLLRFKSDGDSYQYCGINHKLKKVFNDRNIPPSQRSLIPILCDANGIVVVPGMSVRDGAQSDVLDNNITITFAYGISSDDELELYTALLRK